MKVEHEIAEAQRAFGARIKKLREKKGLTQEDMDFDEWAIPVRTIQAIESGRTDIKFSTAYKISKKLDVSMKVLFSQI